MAYIEDLPKVSLHEHLDGGVRPETIIDIAARDGIELPADTPDELADWFVEQCSGGSLEDYLETFAITVGVMQRAEDLRRIAYEYALDLADDGVIYAEVRWAPEQHLAQGLTMSGAVDAVQAGLEEAMDELEERGVSLRVTQVLTALRHTDRSLAVAQVAVEHRHDGVVGFDLAGAEYGHPPEAHLHAFSFLADQHIPVTVHAGEAAGLDSVHDALVAGRALRLGHGVRLAEDIDVVDLDEGDQAIALGYVAQWVRDREIALECCPSSNLQTGAIARWGDDIDAHPFDLFYRAGMRVTVSPDNRLMSDTTVSGELARLVEAFEYTLDDVREFQINAALAAFLPLDERLELVERIEEGFASFE